MKRKLHVKKFTLGAIVLLLSVAGCKKDKLNAPVETPGENATPAKEVRLAGDGKYDLLGYGIDVTKDMVYRSSASDVEIIDMNRFEADYLYRLDITTTGSGESRFYGGSSLFEYMKDVSIAKSFGGTASSETKIEGAGKENSSSRLFTASVNKNTEDQNINKFSSAYSYATYEVDRTVKRIRFNGDVDIALLMNYLKPDFLNNLATKSAEELVARYGTHVMLDITLGGRFRYDYSGAIKNETDYQKKTEAVKMGLGFGLGKAIGININSSKTTTEITQATMNTAKRQYSARYYGGTNSGTSVVIDKDGNSSQTINIANWEQSVTPTNAALIDIGKAVYLYHFIADPVKKEQVRVAIENHIRDNQITIVEDYTNELVNVNSFVAKSGGHHYLTTGVVNDFNYWSFLGVEFRAYARQVPGTVPVNVFFSQRGVDHIYTTGVVSDFSWWRSEGIAFYAYSSRIDGTVPIYVHTSRDGQDHYYSPSSVTFDPGYWSPSVSVAFYAYPF